MCSSKIRSPAALDENHVVGVLGDVERALSPAETALWRKPAAWRKAASPFAVSISGYVQTAGGAGIDGVTVTVTGGFGGSATTNSSGYYRVSGLANGFTYTVTPSKAGYTFNPPSRVASHLPNC